VVPGKLARPRLTLITLATLEVAVVAAIGIAYGSDGPASTVVALVLAPVAVTLTWRLADRIAGPRFANLAAAVYVLLPGLAALTMLGTYRSTFLHRAVPDLVGLRGTPWFVLGLAIGAAALLRVAAPVLAVAGFVLLVTSWDDLGAIRIGLHETAWSIAMLEWLAVAGVVGAALRSRVRAAGLAGWLALALGLAARRGYDDAAFWQSLALAAPAIAVLLSSLWLLVPPLRLAPAPTSAR
jgi:hypothetical protein